MASNENILCRLILDDFDSVDDGVEEVMVTDGGVLKETKRGTVVSSCNLNELSRTSAEILVFYSSTPRFKHYLVKVEHVVVVVKKGEVGLKVIEKVRGVSHCKVVDHLGVGTPQAVLWFVGSDLPRVTDFSDSGIPEEIVAPALSNSFTSALISQLQFIQSEVSASNKILQAKKRLSIVTLKDFVSNLSGETEGLVPCFKSYHSTQPGNKGFLQIGKPWFRILWDVFIVGFTVKNFFDSECLAFQFLMTDPVEHCCKTYLYSKSKNPHGDSVGINFTKSSVLPINSPGIIIVQTNEPKLLTSELSIRGLLSFKTNKSRLKTQQGHVEPIVASAGELLINRMQIKCEEDILATIAIALEINLKISSKTSLRIEELMCTKLGFEKCNNYYYIMHNNTRLSGVLISITERKAYHLRTFTHNLNQFLLLFQSLKSMLPAESTIEVKRKMDDENMLSQLMIKETSFLLNKFKEKLSARSGPLREAAEISVGPDEWQFIQNEYLRLQGMTDWEMHNLVKEFL